MPRKKSPPKPDLSVPGLLQRANKAKQVRLKRASALENKNEEGLRAPAVRLPPAYPIHWGYGFSFDEAIDVDERAPE